MDRNKKKTQVIGMNFTESITNWYLLHCLKNRTYERGGGGVTLILITGGERVGK